LGDTQRVRMTKNLDLEKPPCVCSGLFWEEVSLCLPKLPIL